MFLPENQVVSQDCYQIRQAGRLLPGFCLPCCHCYFVVLEHISRFFKQGLGKKENDFFKSIRQKQLTIYVLWDRKCQSCDLIDDKQYRPKKPSRISFAFRVLDGFSRLCCWVVKRIYVNKRRAPSFKGGSPSCNTCFFKLSTIISVHSIIIIAHKIERGRHKNVFF